MKHIKKIITLLLATSMILSLAACGKTGQDDGHVSDGGSNDKAMYMPDAKTFVKELAEEYEGLDSLADIRDAASTEDTDAILESLYPGITELTVEDMTVQETMMSVANQSVVIIVLYSDATKEDMDKAESILEARRQAQAEGGAFYPESCVAWENAVIAKQGHAIAMFVNPDKAQAQEMAEKFQTAYDVQANPEIK